MCIFHNEPLTNEYITLMCQIYVYTHEPQGSWKESEGDENTIFPDKHIVRTSGNDWLFYGDPSAQHYGFDSGFVGIKKSSGESFQLFEGQKEYARFGDTVNVSADTKTLAVGSSCYFCKNAVDAGAVFIYQRPTIDDQFAYQQRIDSERLQDDKFG